MQKNDVVPDLGGPCGEDTIARVGHTREPAVCPTCGTPWAVDYAPANDDRGALRPCCRATFARVMRTRRDALCDCGDLRVYTPGTVLPAEPAPDEDERPVLLPELPAVEVAAPRATYADCAHYALVEAAYL
jgi:hypothetical protein